MGPFFALFEPQGFMPYSVGVVPAVGRILQLYLGFSPFFATGALFFAAKTVNFIL